MKKIILLSIFLIPIICNSQTLGVERVKKLKESVVRVLIEDKPSGTAFFASEDGLLVSCWHVIEPAMIRDSISNSIIGVKKMSIEFSTQEKVNVDIPIRLIENNYDDAIALDYVLLVMLEKPKTRYSFLKLGDFNNVNEGDAIYSNGYPLGVQQNFISVGVLSTKWSDSTQVINAGAITKTYKRYVAWLDLTMNKGNSGGPIVKMGKTPQDDEVIGIATFILNPYAQGAEELAKLLGSGLLPDMQVTTEVEGESIPIFSNNQVSLFFAEAISKNSIGVSGCVSINHLLETIK